jgi:hypothetical protein
VAKASDLLFQLIRDRSHDLAALADDQPPTEPFSQDDPYLLSSATQKAVRRGDIALARRAGHHLLALDPARLWRRLMTLALEDIGIGDTDAAADLVAISTLKAARRVLGGDRHALEIALARACGALKDRSGDHLLSIVGREPIQSADQAALRSASANALLAMMASSSLPWTRRVRAAVMASGRDERAGSYGAPGLGAVLDVAHEMGVSPVFIVACEAYAARSRDLLPVVVPVAAMLSASARPQARDATSHELAPVEMIDGWPGYAFDPLWTRTGKRAVDLWLRSYLAKPQWLPRQVAAALWNAESAACDRTLSWPLGDTIRERANAADLSFRGLPPDRHAELNDWIARERSVLTCARTAAFASAVRASTKPAEASEQANLPLLVPARPQRRG